MRAAWETLMHPAPEGVVVETAGLAEITGMQTWTGTTVGGVHTYDLQERWGG